MASAPCTGPCNVSLVEWLAYGVLVLGAVGVTWFTHRVAHSAVGSGPNRVAMAEILTVGVAVALTAGLTIFATDQIARHAWPTVVVGQRGQDLADPIALGGTYS